MKKSTIEPENKSYIENHLIAYIGNKRRLIPLLERSMELVAKWGSTKVNKNGLFIDYFAGTGVVSRLARSMGFQVIANDWEYYSYIINKAFLELSNSDISLFDEDGGLAQVLEELNELSDYNSDCSYISDFYCPKSDTKPDPENERMFYTRENGIRIDNMRQAIDERFAQNEKKHSLLLALLIYEASRRSNTSGVFKGFHYGFGGKNGDALSRILSPVTLEMPELGNYRPAEVRNCDALELVHELKDREAEIVYLDPPYNQHQYGSNYHLLNTIAKNDKPEVNKSFWIDGKKKDKSAIRKDWTKTKSPFCYRDSAIHDFKNLISEINSKYILVSYSTEGIIPFDEMVNLLSQKGKIGIASSSYTRYRGGRQSLQTKAQNIEFVLLVDTHACCEEKDRINVYSIIQQNLIQNLKQEVFKKDVIAQWDVFRKTESALNNVEIILNDHLALDESFFKSLLKTQYSIQKKSLDFLSSQCFSDSAAEIQYLLSAIADTNCALNISKIKERIENKWNKIHQHKYPEIFSKIEALAAKTEKKILINFQRPRLRKLNTEKAA